MCPNQGRSGGRSVHRSAPELVIIWEACERGAHNTKKRVDAACAAEYYSRRPYVGPRGYVR